MHLGASTPRLEWIFGIVKCELHGAELAAVSKQNRELLFTVQHNAWKPIHLSPDQAPCTTENVTVHGQTDSSRAWRHLGVFGISELQDLCQGCCLGCDLRGGRILQVEPITQSESAVL